MLQNINGQMTEKLKNHPLGPAVNVYNFPQVRYIVLYDHSEDSSIIFSNETK